MRKFLSIIVAVVAIFATFPVLAQENGCVLDHYNKREVMIPMRDGVRLYTSIYFPKDTTILSPVLVTRTPYSLAPYFDPASKDLPEIFQPYVNKKYILVFQNVRGTMASEGVYENIRPINFALLKEAASKMEVKEAATKKKGAPAKAKEPVTSESTTDEATDTYDTVDWLLEYTSTNGNIGFRGVSYDGFYATIAALCGHPAIKAVSPQAPVSDWFLGDDLHLNGAFANPAYTFGARHFRSRPAPVTTALEPVVTPVGDYYDYFLDKGGLGELFQDFGDSLTFFNEIREHPQYDGFWQRRCPLYNIKPISAAMMVVGGWYDSEDLFGTLATYDAFKRQSPESDLYLVMGPWMHGSWNDLSFNRIGDTWMGAGSARYFHEEIEFKFFEKYISRASRVSLPKVMILPSGDTGEEMKEVNTDDQWIFSDSWPLHDLRPRYFYLNPDKTLTNVPPKAKKGSHSYVSAPQRPVPCTSVPMVQDWAFDQVTGDQSYLTWRSDVLDYTSAELKDTMTVMGPVTAHLKLAVSTTDADMVVKLIDVRPDGYEMMVRWTLLPLRYRNSFTTPEPMVPGEKVALRLELKDVAHHFLPGHRVKVQIQSSMFPWIAMNPQKFMENPYEAVKRDYQKSEITLFCNHENASYIVLPTLQ